MLAKLGPAILPSPTGAPPAQVATAPTAPTPSINPTPLVTPPPGQATASTGAPAVAYAQFEPLTGRIFVQFTADPAGYDPAVLTNPANYGFTLLQAFEPQPTKSHSRPSAGIVLPPPYTVTGVSLTTPTAPGMPPSVIVGIDNNAPLRFGIYGFTIRSAGLTDLAGRPLDGTFKGTFPSGNGQGGGDFATVLSEVNSTVLPALPVTPQPVPPNPSGVTPGYVFFPTTRAVRVRYLAAKPGQFMLAGGNNITLKALRFQFFPGLFRLPTSSPALIPGARTHVRKG